MSIITKIFRKKENKFNRIISLGYNCEVAFRTVKYFKFEESNLFNWSFSYSIDNLINALNNFSDIGNGDFELVDCLWQCKNTKISFHGKASLNIYINNTATDEQKEADKNELIGRIKYLKEKFISILKDETKKLYIYKIKNEDIDENINNKILELQKALFTLGGNNFKLLIVSRKEYEKYFNDKNNYIYRAVKFFAPDNDVISKKYFKNGWNDIFDEFYQDRIKTKKKKYKFES